MKSFLHGFNATVPENKSSRILHFSVAEECSSENDGFSDYHGVPENVLVSDRLLPNHLCSKNAINNYFTRSFHYSAISFLCFFFFWFYRHFISHTSTYIPIYYGLYCFSLCKPILHRFPKNKQNVRCFNKHMAITFIASVTITLLMLQRNCGQAVYLEILLNSV